MRVIAGEFRSRQIEAAPGLETRPTPDRLRETLFSVLQREIPGCVFVDAYAGTGAVGIEAISRGARHVVFIEKSRAALNLLKKNLASLNAEPRARVIAGSSAVFLANVDADIVFMDPPYEKEREYAASLEVLGIKAAGLVIVQHSKRLKLLEKYGLLGLARSVRQGDNVLSFYRRAESE